MGPLPLLFVIIYKKSEWNSTNKKNTTKPAVYEFNSMHELHLEGS